MDTLQRIDQLSEERSRLYRLGLGERRNDPEVRERISEITLELDKLWELRRRERVGRPEGIDRVVEEAYARIYGDDYLHNAPLAPEAEEAREDVALVA